MGLASSLSIESSYDWIFSTLHVRTLTRLLRPSPIALVEINLLAVHMVQVDQTVVIKVGKIYLLKAFPNDWRLLTI